MSGKKLWLETFEIETLNVDSLSVEELEQRLELASGVPEELLWFCFTHCDHTSCNCNGTLTCDCYGLCATYTCDTNCDTLCTYYSECPTNTEICPGFGVQ